MKGEPSLTDGNKLVKAVVKEGLWDPRLLDQGHMPDLDSPMDRPYTPDPLPHPVAEGWGAKGQAKTPRELTASQKHQLRAARGYC